MGTSGAYGGTAGWGGVADQTEEWIEGRPDQPSDSEANEPANAPTAPPQETLRPDDAQAAPAIVPAQIELIRQLGRHLARDPSQTSVAPGAPRARPGGSSGGGSRSATRASRAGARAAAGAYGLRAGVPGPLAEIGLRLADLEGLSKHEQAQRILDAALGPSGTIDQTEYRRASAELLIWALNQTEEPTPEELANRWVVEYTWTVWVTEAGALVNRLAKHGQDRLRIEQEMRAALEATVSAHALPTGGPLTTTEFQTTIRAALESLARIGGAAA